MTYSKLRVIISGGGTGGHIFPAVSIANRLKEVCGDTEILFVGAEGKMEMEKVPAAGYHIEGLPIVGLQRQLRVRNICNNIKVPFKILQSVRKAGRLIDSFKPDIAVGVGGYASAPLLWSATSRRIPTLIQEQNSFAGLTNRILAKRVGCICVAYEGMERFFPSDRIVFSGNPIRGEFHDFTPEDKALGCEFYSLDPEKKHILIVGGSLGSGTLNRAMKEWIQSGCPSGEGVQILWQCGKYYKKGVDEFMQGRVVPDIVYSDFIGRMDLAYAMADLVVSRSGASSISEICASGKAALFVPSPNVSEDHQTHNAMALVRHGAAIMVKDQDAPLTLMKTALETVHNREMIEQMGRNAAAMAKTDAAAIIVDEIYKLAGK